MFPTCGPPLKSVMFSWIWAEATTAMHMVGHLAGHEFGNDNLPFGSLW